MPAGLPILGALLTSKGAMTTDPLSLDLATEAELAAIAEGPRGDRQREARALLLDRARRLAADAAAILRAGLDRVWPEWQNAGIRTRTGAGLRIFDRPTFRPV